MNQPTRLQTCAFPRACLCFLHPRTKRTKSVPTPREQCAALEPIAMHTAHTHCACEEGDPHEPLFVIGEQIRLYTLRNRLLHAVIEHRRVVVCEELQPAHRAPLRLALPEPAREAAQERTVEVELA